MDIMVKKAGSQHFESLDSIADDVCLNTEKYVLEKMDEIESVVRFTDSLIKDVQIIGKNIIIITEDGTEIIVSE